ALSDPTHGDAFFAATLNSNFPRATTFIGDYSGIAVTPTGVAALWTDMRLPSPEPYFPQGWDDHASFARVNHSPRPLSRIGPSSAKLRVGNIGPVVAHLEFANSLDESARDANADGYVVAFDFLKFRQRFNSEM